MSIYAISDLHLSFNTNKPMKAFGWGEYENIIKEDWKQKVHNEDLVLLPGDFSWEMQLKNTYKDFKFISDLPGKKLLLKGNHDYWWTTLKSMRTYLKENNILNIDFLHNNSYEFEDKIIVGTRGWNINPENEEESKIKARELIRLELSIKDGLEKYGSNKDIIACMHYPPITRESTSNEFTDILEKYNVKKCIYGHLHGKAQKIAIEGNFNGVEYKMVSCDFTEFKLTKLY